MSPSSHRRWRRARAGAAQTATRARLRVLEAVAPAAAGRAAVDLWCTYPAGGRSRDLRPSPGTVRRLPAVRAGDVVVETWGDGPVVYLVHGWGGWRGQLGAFVGPLVAAGYRVVAFDAPGHGDARPGFMGPGRGTVMELMEAFEVVGQEHGPAAGVVAHSLGSTSAAHVLHEGFPAERLVLVAPNGSFVDLVGRFASALHLGERTTNQLRYFTDNAGVAAFDEPGLMDAEVFFHLAGHGYEVPKDGFGYRGVRLTPKAGGTATVKVKRVNIAERLYRVTGDGLYAESVKAGRDVPFNTSG